MESRLNHTYTPANCSDGLRASPLKFIRTNAGFSRLSNEVTPDTSVLEVSEQVLQDLSKTGANEMNIQLNGAVDEPIKAVSGKPSARKLSERKLNAAS